MNTCVAVFTGIELLRLTPKPHKFDLQEKAHAGRCHGKDGFGGFGLSAIPAKP
jgi:hypothetical protein